MLLLLPGFTTHYLYHSPLTLGHVNCCENIILLDLLFTTTYHLSVLFVSLFFFRPLEQLGKGSPFLSIRLHDLHQ
jgi:hypothetical protein